MSRCSHQTCQTSALASHIPARPNRPPGVSQPGATGPPPHSYILLGGRPLAQPWGQRQRSSPSVVHPRWKSGWSL